MNDALNIYYAQYQQILVDYQALKDAAKDQKSKDFWQRAIERIENKLKKLKEKLIERDWCVVTA